MSPPSQIAKAIADLLEAFRCWRIWSLLAFADIRGRYRRSKFGQVWITLSMAITIAGIGVVYAAIFQRPVAVYLPIVAANLIIWGFMSSLVTEGAGAFIESHHMLRGTSLPRALFPLRTIARCSLAFLHNLALFPLVMVIFGIKPSAVQLLALPGLLALLATSFCLSLCLATACLRFRDLLPIVQSAMNLAFFVSPVIWERNQLSTEVQAWVDWNPLAAFLGIVRDPLLGHPPPPGAWPMAAGTLAAALASGLVVFARYRARIPFFA
jgi:ABC-type polysaccharide/polyol phosphate export permease